MSRTYYKRDSKPRRNRTQREQREKRVELADYEIEFIEMKLDSSISLRM